MTLTVDINRLVRRMEDQASFGETPDGGLDRLALSDADHDVRSWFLSQMEQEELNTRIDEMGNMFGRRPGRNSDAPPVLVGSHLDSQPNGGKFDGALGVIAALELVSTLNDRDIETTHPIEIVNWTNEEGTRFPQALQGSGVWAGVLDQAEQYAMTDPEGRTVREALEEIDFKGDEPCEPRGPYDTYFELHIEQSPHLDRAGKDIGIVDTVVGISRGRIHLMGQANHAGPTPIDERANALLPAAEVISASRELTRELGEDTTITVGSVDVSPGVPNIIPGEVTVTWDIRAPNEVAIGRATDRLIEVAQDSADRDCVDVNVEEYLYVAPVEFATRCVDAIEEATAGLGYSSMHLVARAGHDACMVQEVCDTGLIFAVSEDGISHSPDEYTSWEDCYRATNTLLNSVLTVAK